MDPHLRELAATGAIGPATLEWAQAYRQERGGSLDRALLELDLVDEADLLNALEAFYHMPAMRPVDISYADPDLKDRLPESFGRSFRMCPLRFAEKEIVALVEAPLPGEWLLELHDLFGLEVSQLLATSHHLALARERIYGTPCGERTHALERRLAQRRETDVRATLNAVESAASVFAAATAVLDFAACLVESCAFTLCGDQDLRIIAHRGLTGDRSSLIAVPQIGCTVGTALRHGGFFVGRVAGTEVDQRFYEDLGRPLPTWALVVPVPSADGVRAAFCADNGPRGIATRWVAELTLLVTRLGKRANEWRRMSVPTHDVQPSALDPTAAELSATLDLPVKIGASPRSGTSTAAAAPVLVSPSANAAVRGTAAASDRAQPAALVPTSERPPTMASGEAVGRAPLSETDHRALVRLRRAAALADISLDALVAQLLAEEPSAGPPSAGPSSAAPPSAAPSPAGLETADHPAAVQPAPEQPAAAPPITPTPVTTVSAPAANDATQALVGELRDLFDKLATAIPAQMARGMENAFRDIVPRIATGPVSAPTAPTAGARTAPTADIEIVQREAAPREVASYRSKRQKIPRRKL